MTTISNGSRVVKTTEQNGIYTSRLYVNHGDTATLIVAKARTLKGAQAQAKKMLK